MTKNKKLIISLISVVCCTIFFFIPDVTALAASASDVQAKVNDALNSIKSILTGLLVTVGVVVSIWIIIKKLPGIDDPHTKNEMFRGVGMTLAAVGLGASVVWLVPWVYELFI